MAKRQLACSQSTSLFKRQSQACGNVTTRWHIHFRRHLKMQRRCFANSVQTRSRLPLFGPIELDRLSGRCRKLRGRAGGDLIRQYSFEITKAEPEHHVGGVI